VPGTWLTTKDYIDILLLWASYGRSRCNLYMYNDESVFIVCPSIYCISLQMSGIVWHYASVFILKISSNYNNFESHKQKRDVWQNSNNGKLCLLLVPGISRFRVCARLGSDIPS
jgi:hypothetical protein